MKIGDVIEMYAGSNFDKMNFIREYRTSKRNLYGTLFPKGKNEMPADPSAFSDFYRKLQEMGRSIPISRVHNPSMKQIAEWASHYMMNLEILNRGDILPKYGLKNKEVDYLKDSLNNLYLLKFINGHIVGKLTHSFIKKLIKEGDAEGATKVIKYLDDGLIFGQNARDEMTKTKAAKKDK